jgi:hypothetical protein
MTKTIIDVLNEGTNRGKGRPLAMDPKYWKPDKNVPKVNLESETFYQKYRRYELELKKVPAGFNAMRWLYNKIINNKDNKKQGFISRPLTGQLTCFGYEAKYKDTLPYWDMYPLVFVVGFYKDGFLGMNLHYIPPVARRRVIQEVLKAPMMNMKTGDKLLLPVLAISKGFPSSWRKCFKRYLKKHILTSFINIPEEEWLVATLLPMASFQNASQNAVWSDMK